MELFEAIRDKPCVPFKLPPGGEVRLMMMLHGRVPLPEEWSDDVKSLLERMLEKNPARRIEMAALRVRWVPLWRMGDREG